MNKTWGENMVILTKLLLIYVSDFICTLIHELGHFLVAMQLGVEVEELNFGNGRKLFSFRFFKNQINFRLLPFRADNKLKKEDLLNQSNRNYVLILIAGVIFNLVAALIIALLFYDGILEEALFLVNQTLSIHTWKQINLIEIFTMPESLFFINSLIVINILNVLVNLIPLPGSDGFEIVSIFLNSLLYTFRGGRKISLIFRWIATILCTGCLLVVLSATNYTINIPIVKIIIVSYSFLVLYFILSKEIKVNDIQNYAIQFNV